MATVIDIFTRQPVTTPVAGRPVHADTGPRPAWRMLRLHTGHLVQAHHIADLGSIGDPPPGGPPLEQFRAAGREASRTGREPDVTGLVLLGWLDPGDGHPRLWAFGRLEASGEGDVLFLDEHGWAHVAKADRRYRCGYRWRVVDPLDACWMLHIPVRPLAPSAS
jgi:hypothetical protein